MGIRVRFFASLAESLRRREAVVEYRENLTVEKLWAEVTGQPKIPPRVLCAVNMEYSEPGQSLRDGDEVAYFPPVTGGEHDG